MTDTKLTPLRRMARLSEEFPGQLATFQSALKGFIPDNINFTEDSYDELFAILVAALYYVKDAKLRKASANASGGNPRLVKMLMDEGVKDKDAALAERIIDRIAPYVPPKVLIETLATIHANTATEFREYHGAIQRMTADLFRIATGFAPAECCPATLVKWASGPNRTVIYAELFG